MPIRKTPLVTDHYYHIYNRGVARQPTFFEKRDYEHLLLAFRYYRLKQLPKRLSYFLKIPSSERETWLLDLELTSEKLVEINCFVLMPNHFHLLVKQLENGGITTFLRQCTNSYTRYINTKANRVGPLFQGEFRAVLVETNEQLLHLSRYIHLNPFVSSVTTREALASYPWSSLTEYLGIRSFRYLEPSVILDQFSSRKSYKDFVFDYSEYAKLLENIKHLMIEKEDL